MIPTIVIVVGVVMICGLGVTCWITKFGSRPDTHPLRRDSWFTKTFRNIDLRYLDDPFAHPVKSFIVKLTESARMDRIKEVGGLQYLLPVLSCAPDDKHMYLSSESFVSTYKLRLQNPSILGNSAFLLSLKTSR